MTSNPQSVFILTALIGQRSYLDVFPRFDIFFRNQEGLVSLESSYNHVGGLATFTVVADSHIDDDSVRYFTDLVQNTIGAETYTFRNDDGQEPQSFSIRVIKVESFRDSVLQSIKEFFSLWLISGEYFGYNTNYFGRSYIRLVAFGPQRFHPKMIIGLDGLLEKYPSMYSFGS